MRLIVFPALYLSVGIAAAQSVGYGVAGWMLAAITLAVLMGVMHATFGLLGGK